MPSAASTPLLLLLDSVLSQDEDEVRNVMTDVSNRLRKAGVSLPPLLQKDLIAPMRSTEALCMTIQALCATFPLLAQTCSEHDGSLPLHFAASLGKPAVAGLILAQVRQAGIVHLLSSRESCWDRVPVSIGCSDLSSLFYDI